MLLGCILFFLSHTLACTLSAMANKDNRHNKRSICEMSMLLVANIIRLSSLSFSGLSFTTNLSPPQDPGKGNTTSVPKFSKKSKQLQQPEINTKMPGSCLMKPEKEGPTTFVRQDLNDVDINAENYMSQIRGKIGNDAHVDATSTTAAPKRFSAKPCSSGIVR